MTKRKIEFPKLITLPLPAPIPIILLPEKFRDFAIGVLEENPLTFFAEIDGRHYACIRQRKGWTAMELEGMMSGTIRFYKPDKTQ